MCVTIVCFNFPGVEPLFLENQKSMCADKGAGGPPAPPPGRMTLPYIWISLKIFFTKQVFKQSEIRKNSRVKLKASKN